MPPKDKYTDPELRDEVKEEIHQGDKGGAPGQWSARKAQMMASEYKKRGGGYTTDKKDQDDSQAHLSKWGEEDWQTKEGSANAKQPDGTQKRYLPKSAWDQMSESEKRATDDKKQAESKKGKQFVQNTDKAKQSRQQANDEEDEEFEKRKNAAKDEKNAEEDNANAEEENQHAEDASSTGEKRTRSSKSPSSPSKKQKANSGQAKQSSTPQKSSPKKSTDAPAHPGSQTRLPAKNQTVHWKSPSGWTQGQVLEIAYQEKEIEGKKVEATKEDPRVVLRSSASGKIAVHKPDAVYFDDEEE